MKEQWQCATTTAEEEITYLADQRKRMIDPLYWAAVETLQGFYLLDFSTVSSATSLPLFHNKVPTAIRFYVLTVNDTFWIWCPLVYICSEHLPVCGYGHGCDLTDTVEYFDDKS